MDVHEPAAEVPGGEDQDESDPGGDHQALARLLVIVERRFGDERLDPFFLILAAPLGGDAAPQKGRGDQEREPRGGV